MQRALPADGRMSTISAAPSRLSLLTPAAGDSGAGYWSVRLRPLNSWKTSAPWVGRYTSLGRLHCATRTTRTQKNSWKRPLKHAGEAVTVKELHGHVTILMYSND